MSVVGETLFAAVGLRDFLTPGPILITEAIRDRASQVPRHIQESVRRVLRGERAKLRKRPDWDWRKSIDLLTQPASAEEVITRLGRMNPPAAGADAASVAAKATVYLRALLPKRQHAPLIADGPPQPSMFEEDRLRTAWEIAEDPMVAFHDLEAWALSLDQAAALVTIFPDLYEFATVEIALGIGELQAGGEKLRIPWKLEKQFRNLASSGPRDAELGRLLQAGIASSSNEKATTGSGGASGGGPITLGQRAQTPTERVSAR